MNSIYSKGFQGIYESREIIRRKPIAISACDERMLRVVVFDSTHTQGSSKYFLIIITKTGHRARGKHQ